jgi:4'-phosphopantetheinyl transferase
LWPVPVAERPDWLELLSDDERMALTRFKVAPARATYATSRAAQRLILGHYLGAGVVISRRCQHCDDATHGRPHVPGAGLDFSVSHTTAWVIVAVVSAGLVGIDIEAMNAARSSAAELSRVTMTAAEQRRLGTVDPEPEFLRLWTRKEAAAKLAGLGLRAAFERLDVLASTVDAQDIPAWPDRTIHLYDLPAPADHRAALAATDPLIATSIHSGL